MHARLCLLVALSLMLGFAPAPFPRTRREDRQADDVRQLQGDWVLKSQGHNGGKMREDAGRTRLTIRDGRWSFLHDGQETSAWDVRVNASVVPRALDMSDARGRATLLAIYRLQNGELTMRYRSDDKRPAGFGDEETKDTWEMVFRRR